MITAIFLPPITGCSQNQSEITWPNGAKAAICLTYDDGLSSHVNTVGPMLNKYNFKATFYPTLSSASIHDEMDKWKQLAKDGHELGNHTVYHPCQKSVSGMDWVPDHLDLDTYSMEQVLAEIALANSFLKSLDGLEIRTFAYPCGHFMAGGESFKDSLSNYAIAGRDASESNYNLRYIDEIDPFMLPSWAPNEHDADDLIDYIKAVISKKTLSTFTFHGVGAEHMQVSTADHEKMLQFLDSHQSEVWVTTVKDAVDYMNALQNDALKKQ